MVTDYSDGETRNLLPSQQVLLFHIYVHHPTDRIVHTTAFVTPVTEHWLEQEIAQWIHHEGLIGRHGATSISVFKRFTQHVLLGVL